MSDGVTLQTEEFVPTEGGAVTSEIGYHIVITRGSGARLAEVPHGQFAVVMIANEAIFTVDRDGMVSGDPLAVESEVLRMDEDSLRSFNLLGALGILRLAKAALRWDAQMGSGTTQVEVTPAMFEAGIDAIAVIAPDITDTTEPRLMNKVLASAFRAMLHKLS